MITYILIGGTIFLLDMFFNEEDYKKLSPESRYFLTHNITYFLVTFLIISLIWPLIILHWLVQLKGKINHE